VLEAIVSHIPPPQTERGAPLKAMLFDSIYDSYRGAIPYVRMIDGEVRKGDIIKFYSTGKTFEVDEVGHLILKRVPARKLSAGEVGYLICNIRRVADTRVGDTVTHAVGGTDRPFPDSARLNRWSTPVSTPLSASATSNCARRSTNSS
jgi:GTP-binding protein LepA